MKHSFSVEMKAKKFVKSISISDEAHERVLFEGDLGELQELFLVEGDALEFVGVNGILRIGVTEDQLREALKRPSCEPSQSAEEGRLRNAQTAKRENGGKKNE